MKAHDAPVKTPLKHDVNFVTGCHLSALTLSYGPNVALFSYRMQFHTGSEFDHAKDKYSLS
jgi:hypothetical protein